MAKNMIAQVDDKGNKRALFEEMMDHWTDGLEVKQQDAFIAACAGTEHHRETTKGREILIQWKDGRKPGLHSRTQRTPALSKSLNAWHRDALQGRATHFGRTPRASSASF
jgi:hypothetical protein